MSQSNMKKRNAYRPVNLRYLSIGLMKDETSQCSKIQIQLSTCEYIGIRNVSDFQSSKVWFTVQMRMMTSFLHGGDDVEAASSSQRWYMLKRIFSVSQNLSSCNSNMMQDFKFNDSPKNAFSLLTCIWDNVILWARCPFTDFDHSDHIWALL